jgi:hypothetical protein
MNDLYYNQIQWDEASLNQWKQDNGDNTHNLNWDLNCDSIVLDIGSYKGQWLQTICNKYNCYGIGCEPTQEAFLESFSKISDKISFINCGVTVEESSDIKMNVGTDDSSIVRKLQNSKEETVKMFNVNEFFKTILKNPIINLVQINIEGYEYVLLPYMISMGLFNNIKAVQIQFHNISDQCDKKKEDICKSLKDLGFETKFDYRFVWYGAIKK